MSIIESDAKPEQGVMDSVEEEMLTWESRKLNKKTLRMFIHKLMNKLEIKSHVFILDLLHSHISTL